LSQATLPFLHWNLNLHHHEKKSCLLRQNAPLSFAKNRECNPEDHQPSAQYSIWSMGKWLQVWCVRVAVISWLYRRFGVGSRFHEGENRNRAGVQEPASCHLGFLCSRKNPRCIGGGRDDALSATLPIRAIQLLTGHLIPIVRSTSIGESDY
jgi:hypothetical protein